MPLEIFKLALQVVLGVVQRLRVLGTCGIIISFSLFSLTVLYLGARSVGQEWAVLADGLWRNEHMSRAVEHLFRLPPDSVRRHTMIFS